MHRRRRDSEQLKLLLPDSSDIERLYEENHRLRAENDRLRTQVANLLTEIEQLRGPGNQSSPHETNDKGPTDVLITERDLVLPQRVTKRSSIEEKIRLFRDYFKGREDVYAVRGVERDGKAPYYPKRQYLSDGTDVTAKGDYLPLTNDVIRAHLQEETRPVVVGLYPLLLDETCWLLAVDFDKVSWREDASAFLETCDECGVVAALERSRSGNGGHVWIFFEKPISARTARALGATLLTRTLEKRHQIGLDSYDRMFPNQDTLPKDKKLGNLIALPLQRMAGKLGNTLFIDATYNPYPDQWTYLSSLRKMKPTDVEAILKEERRYEGMMSISSVGTRDDEGQTLNEPIQHLKSPSPSVFPRCMTLVLSNMLYVPKDGLDSSQINYLRSIGAFQNPEFYKAQSMRLSTYGKPRIIDCSEETAEYIAVPRGCQEEVFAVLRDHGTEITLTDKRNCGEHIDIAFHGQLRPEQHRAVMELSRYDIGTLSAGTAFGKTVVGAWMVAARATNTLILVHRTQLMEQWRDRLSVFLNITTKEIGLVGGGKSRRTGKIDIALIQSLYVNHEVRDWVKDYGHIIVDECHHISAFSFEQVLKRANAKFVLGLTATLIRKDGKHPIVLMQCGPVRVKVDMKSQAKQRPFTHVVIPRYTEFRLSEFESDSPSIQQVYDQLISNEARNDLIFDDLLKSLDQGRSPLLLTDRTAHLEYFQQRLKGFAKNVIVLRGGMGKRQLTAAQEKIKSVPAHAERVILATGRFVGEGFDDERLDALFLVMPISWKGTLQQYAGRLHRLYDMKREVRIYDYVDDKVPVLSRMYQTRLKGYKAMGYTERLINAEHQS